MKNIMKIIRPAHNLFSSKVKNWKEIKKEAWGLKAFLDAKKFEGHWEDAFAISHAQVSAEPKCFFVLNKKMYKTFGSWCIINLEILKKSDPCTYPEGCMSFMFRHEKRVDRFADIKVKYWIPLFNLFLIPKWKRFKDLPAFICGHEFDHSMGINIYGK